MKLRRTNIGQSPASSRAAHARWRTCRSARHDPLEAASRRRMRSERRGAAGRVGRATLVPAGGSAPRSERPPSTGTGASRVLKLLGSGSLFGRPLGRNLLGRSLHGLVGRERGGELVV